MPRHTLSAVLFTLALATVPGCASPLPSRRAQVLEPGEIEVVAAPAVVIASGANLYWGEVSARFGIVDRVDAQLRVDPGVLPEVSAAVQVFGDPTKDELAVTLGAGVKPAMLILSSPVSEANPIFVYVPLQVLVDIPIVDGVTGVVGARAIPSTTTAGRGFDLLAGGTAGLDVELGVFVVRPEIAVTAPYKNRGFLLAASLGVGFHFDFLSEPPSPTPAGSPS